MALQPSPAAPAPPAAPTPAPASANGPQADARFLDLFVSGPEAADVLLVGLPYDGAVLGRKGAREGPTGIRQALRWLGTDGLAEGMLQRTLHDMGDVPCMGRTVLDVHEEVRKALLPVFSHAKPVVLLGGDNSLSFPTLQALAEANQAERGTVGLIVVDAHYDLRAYDDQPTSGTPFRRVLTELPDRPVLGKHLVEVGIRPYANAASLHTYAQEQGVRILSRDDVRRDPEATAQSTMDAMEDVQHIWLSIDIDALDQSIAPGCSAPSMDGLLLHELGPLLERVAKDPRCRGMEIMETAPGLDPTGNTVRSAAWIVGRFVAGRR